MLTGLELLCKWKSVDIAMLFDCVVLLDGTKLTLKLKKWCNFEMKLQCCGQKDKSGICYKKKGGHSGHVCELLLLLV